VASLGKQLLTHHDLVLLRAAYYTEYRDIVDDVLFT